MVDHLVRQRRSTATLNVRVAQNVGAVTLVIYLSGWGPVLVLAFAFVALENISRDGAHLWRATALWSMVGIAAGQAAIWVGWAPSVLSLSHANAVAFMSAFVLFFVIRMAGADHGAKGTRRILGEPERRPFSVADSQFLDITMVVSDGILHLCEPVRHRHARVRARRAYRSSLRPNSSTSKTGTRHRSHHLGIVDLLPMGSPCNSACRPRTVTFRLVEAVVADQRNPPLGRRDLWPIFATSRNERRPPRNSSAPRELSGPLRTAPSPRCGSTTSRRFVSLRSTCAPWSDTATREMSSSSMTIADIRPEEDARRLMNYLRVEHPNLNYAGIWRHRTKLGRDH